MLAATVPGAGLTVGISRRLYAACQYLVGIERELALQADRIAALRPEARRPRDSDQIDEINEERFGAFRRLERQNRAPLLSGVRQGFAIGQDSDWRQLIDIEPPTRIEPPAQQLESATADVYLAIDQDTLV
jgi:hypothetical protein